MCLVESLHTRVAKNFSRHCLVFFYGLFSLASATVAADKAEVSGVMTFNDTQIELPHVYVWTEEEGFYDSEDPVWKILFVGREVAQGDLGDPVWDAAWVEIAITRTSEFGDEPELQVYSQSIKKSADHPGNLSGGEYPKIELTGLGTDKISGRIYHEEAQEFFDDTYHYDFTFSASLSDPNAIVGEPLPSDGGEPGLAYLKWVEAVHSGDLNALRSIVPADLAEQIDSASAEEAKEQLEFFQFTTPTKVKILSGSIDGDIAILKIEGTMENEKVGAEIEMTRMGEFWIPTKTSM